MTNENAFLLHALLLGIFITFVYDILRIFRRVLPHGDFLVSLEDFFFWIYCGGEVFLLMHRESNGTLRWFAVLGALVGMLLYRQLISPWFVKYVSLAFRKAMGFFGKILGKLFKPAAKACKKAGNGVRRLGRRVKRGIKNRLTSFLKMLKITLRAK